MKVESEEPAKTEYDKKFFINIEEHSQKSASIIVPEILKHISARSVVDVGCGLGTFLSEFQKQGVTEILGIDGDYVNRDMLRIAKDNAPP